MRTRYLQIRSDVGQGGDRHLVAIDVHVKPFCVELQKLAAVGIEGWSSDLSRPGGGPERGGSHSRTLAAVPAGGEDLYPFAETTRSADK